VEADTKGRGCFVVLPEMRIEAVNGVTGDLEKMVEALRTCQVAELQVQRGSLFSTNNNNSPRAVEAAAPQLTAELPEKTASAQHLEFHFDQLNFEEVDQVAFKQEFLQSLSKLGASQELLSGITVHLRPGSVIAGVLGPPASMRNLKGLPLEGQVSVMGDKARVVEVDVRPVLPAFPATPAAPPPAPLPPPRAPPGLSWEVILELELGSKKRRTSTKGTKDSKRIKKRNSLVEDKLGFSLHEYSKDFEEKIGIKLEEDVVLVSSIRPGVLTAWNDSQPDSRVQVGDRVLEVNGIIAYEHMLSGIEDHARMLVARPAQYFKITLGRNGHSLGFRYKKRRGKMANLLITEVLTEGALPRHNAEQLRAGRWEFVVLPGMRIWKVNDAAGDQAGMVEAIGKFETIELNIDRSYIKEEDQPRNSVNEGLAASGNPAVAPCEKAWDVQIEPRRPETPPAQDLGFKATDYKQECSTSLGDPAKSDVLLVSDIAPNGQLAQWNAQQPEAEKVQVGDIITQINRSPSPEEPNPPWQMRVTRPPTHFDVTLDKRGGILGFEYRKGRGHNAHYLLITKVHTHGALPDHNATQAAAGRWDLVVLPEMRLEGVNGIKGDIDFMVEALQSCKVVELCIHRQPPSNNNMQLEPLKFDSANIGSVGSPPTSQPGTARAQQRNGLPAVQSAQSMMIWDVELTNDRQSLGFEVTAFSAGFWKQLQIDGAPEVLVVSSVGSVQEAQTTNTTALATWNSQKPSAAMQVGDRILQVNSACTAGAMLLQLQAPSIQLRVARAPNRFEVPLTKQGRSFGICYRKPNHASKHLLITEVRRDSALFAHNAAQAAAGRWDLLVLPEMQIVAVNGIEGHIGALLEELTKSESVTLRIWRAALQSPQSSSGLPSPEAGDQRREPGNQMQQFSVPKLLQVWLG